MGLGDCLAMIIIAKKSEVGNSTSCEEKKINF